MLNNLAFGIVIGMIFISLIVLFCILLVKLHINKIKTYTRQLYQKDIDFQKTLNTTIIETQEQVLHNIAQDLHDDAGQQLTYINFQIENLKLDSPELQQSLVPLSESVQMLSKSIRGISHSLNNQLIIQQDLLKAIETELERMQKNLQLNISFSIKNKTKKSFSTDEKIVIYRIFQEALNNAYKHSRAKSLKVGINTIPYFEMSISDDGNGFIRENENVSSMGLQNMELRAAIINYSLKIETAIGHGTTIRLFENKD